MEPKGTLEPPKGTVALWKRPSENLVLYYTTGMHIVGGQRAHKCVLVQRVNKGPLVTM